MKIARHIIFNMEALFFVSLFKVGNKKSKKNTLLSEDSIISPMEVSSEKNPDNYQNYIH